MCQSFGLILELFFFFFVIFVDSDANLQCTKQLFDERRDMH